MKEFGEGLEKIGQGLTGCGCLIFVLIILTALLF